MSYADIFVTSFYSHHLWFYCPAFMSPVHIIPTTENCLRTCTVLYPVVF